MRRALAYPASLLGVAVVGLATIHGGCADLSLNLLLAPARDEGGAGDEAGVTGSSVTPCSVQSQCAEAGAPLCNVEAGACVQCLSSADCSGSTPHCIDGVCVACTTSADCPSSKVCNTYIPRCETACIYGDTCLEAGLGPCAVDYGYCVECLTNADCVTAPLLICNPPPYGVCVQCMTNADCKGGATCGPAQRCASP